MTKEELGFVQRECSKPLLTPCRRRRCTQSQKSNAALEARVAELEAAVAALQRNAVQQLEQ